MLTIYNFAVDAIRYFWHVVCSINKTVFFVVLCRNRHCDDCVQCCVRGTVVSVAWSADLGEEETPRWLVGRRVTGAPIVSSLHCV